MRKSTELTFYIETLGCPKNRVDSRTMAANLITHGFSRALDVQDADIIIINTCSFVREAQEETIETAFETIGYKQKEKAPIVGLVGCFAQQFAKELEKEMPEIDFSMGVGRYHEIPHVLSERFHIELSAPSEMGHTLKNDLPEANLPYSYFRIARGCSRSCAFCTIPFIRGPHTGFTLEEIQEQYRQETMLRGDLPLREAILVSQDTVATPYDELRRILDFFEKKEHLHWSRLHYLFPDKRVLKILELYDEFEKLVPYLDIPFQHISPAILRRMGRPDDTALFHEIIHKALEKAPDMEIRTALILGYPGETEDDIARIEDFLESVPIHKLSLFRYSHETDSPAGKTLQDDIPEEEKIERINRVRSFHLERRKKLRDPLVGQKTLCMVEQNNSYDQEIIARRPQDSPEIDEVVIISSSRSDLSPGDMIEVELSVAMEYDWLGELA